MTAPRPELELLAEIDLIASDGPVVVAIGGGHGLARALEAVTAYAGAVTAIVTVADDGGSSGRLTPALEVPPPGDVRRALLALTDADSPWRDLVAYRFADGDVAGHSLGNLILAALTDLLGDFESAVDAVGAMLGARGIVVPSASVPLTLCADVDGTEVRGQVAIARSRGHVERLWVDPPAAATPAALRAISAADQIVLAPGSLYTSLLAVLVVDGVVEAINASSGALVQVANLTTQDGETLGLTGSDHVDELTRVSGVRPPDRVIVHDGPLEVPEGLVAPTLDDGPAVVRADVADAAAGHPQHNPARLAAVLRRLVGG
ncbi:MAG: gluconeogenesis factor YvcK family protein [Acidimicrobiia bacterium]